MDYTMRPDYKPGDVEFDRDARLLADKFVIQIHDDKSAQGGISAVVGTLYRQATYWQHEAVTVPTLLDNSVRRAYAELQAKHDAALETIASMARTIERLAK